MGVLTRSQMEQAISSGGSVLLGGRLYTRAAELPSDAQLAQGDPDRELAAGAVLEQQISAMQAQLDQLQASQQQGGRPRIDPFAGTNDVNAPTIATIVGQESAERLAAAGVRTFEDVALASDEQLLAVEGIGPKTLDKLRQAIKEG